MKAGELNDELPDPTDTIIGSDRLEYLVIAETFEGQKFEVLGVETDDEQKQVTLNIARIP